jgi:hypothetical protein
VIWPSGEGNGGPRGQTAVGFTVTCPGQTLYQLHVSDMISERSGNEAKVMWPS